MKISRFFGIGIGIIVFAGVFFEVFLRLSNFVYRSPYSFEDIPFITRTDVKNEGLYQFDWMLFWKYRAGARGKINSHGFRDREFSIKKQGGIRIVALGDSCTAGHQLPTEKTYVKYLERLLNGSLNSKKNLRSLMQGFPGILPFRGYNTLGLSRVTINPTGLSSLTGPMTGRGPVMRTKI